MKGTKGLRNYNLDQLRLRHAHCISMGFIIQDERRAFNIGTVPPSKLKHGIAPVCDAPEDGVCCAPDIPDEYIRENYRGTKTL